MAEGRFLNMTMREILILLRLSVFRNETERIRDLARQGILSHSFPAQGLATKTVFSHALRALFSEYIRQNQIARIETLYRALDSRDFDRDSEMDRIALALYRHILIRDLSHAIIIANEIEPSMRSTLTDLLLSRMRNLTRVDNPGWRDSTERLCKGAFSKLESLSQVREEDYRAFRQDPASKYPPRQPHKSLNRKRPCSLEAQSDEPQPSPYGPREPQPGSSRSCESQPGSSRPLEPQPPFSPPPEPQPAFSPPPEPQPVHDSPRESRPAPSDPSEPPPVPGTPREGQPVPTGLLRTRYVDYFSSGSGSDTHPGMKKRTLNPYIGGFSFPVDVDNSRIRNTAEPPGQSEALGRDTNLGGGSQPEADGRCDSRDAVGLSQQPHASRGKENDSEKRRREEQDSDLSD